MELSGTDNVAGRPPSEIGVHIREALYRGGPKTITELRAELNNIRKLKGMSLVTREYVRRLIREAASQGLVVKTGALKKRPAHRIEGHPEIDVIYQYKIVMKSYKSSKWVRLPEVVARHV